MKNFDEAFVRDSFPAFSEPSLEGLGFFENAGGSYACAQTVEWLDRYYRTTKLQPYGFFDASRIAGEQMDSARQRMADWLNVETGEVHFGPSTSQNTYVLAQALRQELKPGDEVIVTNQDHEANIGAWSRLEDAGIVVREWKVDPDTYELHPMDLEALLNERTRMVAFTHCSNIVASLNPVVELTDMIHKAGAWAFVDGVSFAPHGLPDLRELGVDAYFFSLYKVYGTHQGVMYMSKKLNAELPYQGHFFNAGNPTARFTPAGPDHAQIAASNGMLDYFDSLYAHHGGDPSGSNKAGFVHKLLRQRESELLQPLLDFLDGHARIKLIGRRRAEMRAPTVAFTAEGHHPEELAIKLADRNLGVGAANFYAFRLMEAMGIDPNVGVVRTSLVHYNTAEEVSRLISALDELL